MTSFRRVAAAPAALFLSVFVTACGGGGGAAGDSTTPPPPVLLGAINTSNYQVVGAVVTDPVGKLMDLNDASGLIVGGAEVNEKPLSLSAASLEIYQRALAKNSRLVAGVVTTEPCSNGGSVKIDVTSASDLRYTVGDRLSLTATNCKETGLPAFSGVASFSITAVSGDPVNSNRYSLGLGSKFENFTLEEGTEKVAINGDLAITASQSGTTAVTVGLTGKSLDFKVTAAGVSNSYQLASYSFNGTEANGTTTLSGKYTVTGSSAKVGGNYTFNVETVQPLVVSASSANPSSGALIVRGSPATVTITALAGGSVRLDYSDKGDSVITATNTLTWTAFDALN